MRFIFVRATVQPGQAVTYKEEQKQRKGKDGI